MRKLNLLLSMGIGFLSINAWALTVEPFAPTKIVSPGGLATVYYADTSTGAPIVVDPEYPRINMQDTGSGNNVFFYMRDMAADLQYLYVYAEGADSTINFPVRINYATATFNNLNNPTNGDYGQIFFPANSNDIQVGLNFSNICALLSSASGAKGCTGGGNFDTGPSATGMTLKFVQSGSAAIPTDQAVINAGFKLKVYPENFSPVIGNAGVCPAFSSWFFPGDQEFTVNTDQFVGSKNASGVGSTIFDMLVVAVGKPLTASPYFGGSGVTISRIPYQAGVQVVTGNFENSTAGNTPITYETNMGVRSSAGLVTFCNSIYNEVFTSDIQSFLKESNCFIATASFRSGRAAPVMMLRAFRDQILSKFDLGRAFISYYYQEGPEAANWLIKNPIYRVPVLSALIKVEVLAWVALHPTVLISPLFALLGLLIFLGFRSSRSVQRATTAALILALTQIPNAQSAQPYIDSLLSEIPKSAEPVRTIGNPDPYIQSQKAKLNRPATEGSYSESEKRRLQKGAPDSSVGYSEKLKRNLDPKSGGDSAIADFKSGKKLKPNKGGDKTHSAFAFKIATAMERSYIGDATSQEQPYPSVYGDGFVPEFTVSYETHPIQRGFFSNLGILGSLGGSFVKANGKFAYTGPNNEYSSSKTKFTFVTLPMSLGPVYRFHITNAIAPYFGGGGSAIGFIENRNDGKDGVRGYSFGYWGVAGISFGLDFLSEKSSWNQYESTKVKRTYLSLEYSYLTTIPGGLVELTVNGVQAGFTFEY